MKRLVAILLLLASGALRLWGQYDPSHFYYAGRQALSDGKYSLAIENFNILARIDTVGPEAYFFRGIAKYNLGDLGGAERDFDLSLQRNPLYTYAYHYRAITRSRLGRYEEALDDLQEAVELRPGNSGLYFSRGVTYFLSQQFEKAVQDFNSFIRREPDESSAYLNRGASYLFLGDTTKAFADYNKAIELNNLDPEGFVRRSRLYALKNDPDNALSDLDRALALDSTNTLAYFNRAIIRHGKNDWTGAVADLDKVLEQEPGNALTLYNRALIYAQAGELDKAVDDLDRVLNINRENVLAYFNRAAVLMEQGKYRQAISDYDRAIELYPDFAKAYMNRSYAKGMLGRLRESKADWETAQQKVREYQRKTATDEGYEAFADTTRAYSGLLAFDADFAQKNFDNELLQYREVDVKLKPLFQFVPATAAEEQKDIATIGGELMYAKLDNFISALPVETAFRAQKAEADPDAAAALDRVQESIRKGGASEYLQFAKGMLETRANQFNNARGSYSAAIDMDPGNPFLYLNRGALQAEMTEFIASMENSVQTLTIDNTGNTTKTVVKERSDTRYDYSAAIDDMLESARLAPDFPYVYYNLGNLYALSDDLPTAVANYGKALEIFPYIGEAYYNRGLVLIFLKDKEKGCMDISKAGELGIGEAYGVIKKYCSEDTAR